MNLPAPRLAYYGDDFTGATDALATATRNGLRSLLFFGVPTAAQRERAGPLDCLGIAGATRAMAPDAMRAVLRPAAQFFQSLGPRVVHYKVCSTFDSAAQVGNIAVAMQELGQSVRQPLPVIVGGQPSLGRYCVFAQLYAAADGEVHRIDRHPTMSRHPVTPMHEADLRRHFAQLGAGRVDSIDYRTCALGPAAIDERMRALQAEGADAVLFDVARQDDLGAIGAVLAQAAQHEPLLAVGASSVIEALGSQWGNAAAAPADIYPAASGPVLLLAGSLSPVTARQVQAAVSYRKVRLDPQRLAGDDDAYRAAMAAELAQALRGGEHVLAWIDNAQGERTQGVHSHALARAGGRLLDAVLRQQRVHRLGVAGGDSSSLAMQALDAWGLSHLARIEPGVALCRLHSDVPALDGMEVMLKGGQMGSVDLFERLLRGAGG
ncbi:four-carbon acid sugar kinase family protein [Bordetella petrii]|uniref:four-carbon acid sugar kinase family protein n=1 Tax=Bordetella petrii TaxID=94624 RepID=UPI001E511AA7|nr:four-carbon acid sugar kinase family protein [Bordetella petrii]MCD0503853.1 four-carbon acid sugar kinase family protein [Bordetella petrii]